MKLCGFRGCGALTGSRDGRCPAHPKVDSRNRRETRRGTDRQRVWDSALHRGVRLVVFRRDDYTCAHCGKRDGTETGKQLVADHVAGVDAIIAAGGDPFDVDEYQTLCQRCSGKKDGSR